MMCVCVSVCVYHCLCKCVCGRVNAVLHVSVCVSTLVGGACGEKCGRMGGPGGCSQGVILLTSSLFISLGAREPGPRPVPPPPPGLLPAGWRAQHPLPPGPGPHGGQGGASQGGPRPGVARRPRQAVVPRDAPGRVAQRPQRAPVPPRPLPCVRARATIGGCSCVAWPRGHCNVA